jgi:hypothetical protein
MGASVAGCSTQTQSDIGPEKALTSCDEIIPTRVAADVLGAGTHGHLVQLQAEESDPVSPLVDRMVTEGIACGGAVDGDAILDGAVMVGQLAMNEEQWESIQTEFAADGHVAINDFGFAGWIYVSKPSGDPTMGSGFAWRDGVLYYLINPMMLAFVPAFAPEFADAGGVPASVSPAPSGE